MKPVVNPPSCDLPIDSDSLLITIDGPAGAGKTTVSRMLAACLGYRYVDTGALYRAVAYAAFKASVQTDDEDKIEALCRDLRLQLIPVGSSQRILVNGKDVSENIRTPEITQMTSVLSTLPVVRQYLLNVQKALGAEKGVVFEGRDMGTVVFPKADIKFFLDASLSCRAVRRWKEYTSKSSGTLEEIKAQIQVRDRRDSQRTLAPLMPAPDAIRISSDHLSAEEVVAEMLVHIKKIET